MPGQLPISGLALVLQNFAQYQSQIGRAESMTRAMGDATLSVVTAGQRMSRVLGTVGITMAMVGASIAAFLVPAVRMAAELNRLEIVGNGVAGAMKISTAALKAEREELSKLDVNTSDAYQALNGLILSHVDLTKASDLTRAALDMAAFSGAKSSQVLDDYAKAVENASTRTLRQYRIMASADTVYEVYARSLGRTAKSLTEVEKREATLQYILTISKRIAGSYAAVLGTVEGQMRLLAMRSEEAGERIGKALGPVIIKVLKFVNDLLQKIIDLPPSIQAVIGIVLGLVAVFGTLAGTLTLIGPGLKVLAAAFAALPGVLTGTSAMLAGTTSGIGRLVIVAGGAVGRIQNFAASILGINPIVGIVLTALGLLVTGIITNFGGLGDLTKKVFGDIGRSIGQVWGDLRTWGTAGYELVRDAILAPFQWVDKQLRILTGRLSAQNFGFKINVEAFFLGGARIMASFALGILQGINDYVLPTLIEVLNTIASYLVGHSPPAQGPLSDVDMGGVAIIEAWLKGMSSVSTDQVVAIAKSVEEQLTKALWAVQDALYDIESRELELDKALYPLEDQLARVQAAADLVTIPLERQKRVLDEQLIQLKKVNEVARLAAEARLAELEKQTAQYEALVAADKDRLEVINHEIFMEQLRNRILGQATSAKLITMQSSSRVLADQVDQEEASVKLYRDAEKAEKDRIDRLNAAAEKQEKVIQDQIDRLEALIKIESDRVTWAEEELKLARARQIEARLANEQERRFWAEQERHIQHLLDIVGRVKKLVKESTEVIQDWEKEILEGFTPPDITPTLDRTAIEKAKEALKGIFAPVNAEFEKTKLLWGDLQKAWSNLVITVKVEWERDPEALLEKSRQGIKEWTIGVGEDLSTWSTNTGATVKTWATTAQSDIKTFTVNTGEDIHGWADKLGVWIVDHIKKAQEDNAIEWAKIEKDITSTLGRLGTSILINVTLWYGYMTKWVDDVRAALPEKWDELVASVEKWWTDIGGPRFIAIAWDRFLDWIIAWEDAERACTARIHAIGAGIVSGIKKGIENMWEDFVKWLAKKVVGCIGAIMTALGMGSPARIAIPIGEGIVNGIQLGFDRKLASWIRKIQPQVRLVVEGLNRQVQGTEGSRATTNNYYYNQSQGPTISVAAQYSRPQSSGAIRDDIGLLLALTH